MADLDADERTPLLPPTEPPPFITQPPSPCPRAPAKDHHPHIPTHLRPGASISLPRLGRILAALKTGHLPSTVQLLQLCDYALASPLLDEDPSGMIWAPRYGEGRVGTGRLSKAGEKVRLAAREVVWSAREVIEGRNPSVRLTGEGHAKAKALTGEGWKAGDGWQEFVWSCTRCEIDFKLPSTALPPAHANDTALILSSLVSLLQLVFTSPELRQLLIDLIVLLRDTLEVVVERAAKKDQIGEGTKDGLESVSNVGAKKAIEEVSLNTTDPMSSKQDRSKDQEAREKPARSEVEGEKKDEVMDNPPLVNLEEIMAGGAKKGAETPKLPPKTPEEMKDRFLDRLTEILLKLQTSSRYQSAMRTLLAVARSYLSDAFAALAPSASIHPVLSTPSNSSSLPSDTRYPIRAPNDGLPSPLEFLVPLLEPFTGGPTSLSPLRTSFHATFSHLSTTSPSSTPRAIVILFRDLDSYLSRAILESGFLGSSASHRTLGGLYDELLRLGADHPAFQRDLNELLRLLTETLGAVANDPLLGRFMLAMEELGKVIAAWTKNAGATAVDIASGEGVYAVWGDLVEWVVPRVLSVLREVPLPRLEFASPSLSLAIDPPSLLSTSFIPSSLSLHSATSLVYLPALGSSSQSFPLSSSTPPSSRLTNATAAARTSYASQTSIGIRGLRLEVTDVGYFVRYHTGLPCVGDLTEAGLLDVHFGSHPSGGLSFQFDTRTPSPSAAAAQTLFEVLPSSSVKLSHFDIRPHESSHPWLLWAMRPLLRTAVRKAVEIELRKTLLERGGRAAGEWGWRVQEKQKKKKREGEKEGGAGGVWTWLKAAWSVMVEPSEEDDRARTATPDRADAADVDDENEDVPRRTGFDVHVTSRGLAVDLPHPTTGPSPERTVGIGTEGTVLPAGSAQIPSPPGSSPRSGPVAKAKEEADEAVEPGRETARAVMEVAGEVEEPRERWEGDVRRERRRGVGESWRSDAFDLDVM
ncbi:hypothetical protein JCM21900_000242 [Sporobolomyces salmonicolor]